MGKNGLGRRGKEEEGDWGGEEGGSACNGPIVYALFSGLSVAGKFLLVEKRENGTTLEYFMILGFCKICNRMPFHLTANLFAFMGIVHIL
ncbi:hypothetical protein QZH41_005855 [Actinostola sp. cb2023]|nr:hypothetical protein QZH41_005855 [Actinostola sp. cb2023]